MRPIQALLVARDGDARCRQRIGSATMGAMDYDAILLDAGGVLVLPAVDVMADAGRVRCSLEP